MKQTIRKLPKAAYKRICFFLINHIFVSRRSFSNKVKCALLRSLGHQIGTGTTIISPVYIAGTVTHRYPKLRRVQWTEDL